MRKIARTRREFLKQAAIFAAGAALVSCAPPTGPQEPGQPGDEPAAALPGPGDREIQPGVLRRECLIIEDPTGTATPADDFNRWRPGSRTYSTGLQQIALDALWYIDPNEGLDGVWDNAVAAEKPIYNEDFTTMTVKLRQGLYWSDGVEFTAEDLYYTVDVQMKNDGWNYTGQFRGNIESMEMPDKYTVVFNLKDPNSRFHSFFTVRWGACFMMPKHVFEKQEDP
ncbi:MAG: ABC transporter substrate-binding protein, partial [Anaerolineaceae bacterium]